MLVSTAKANISTILQASHRLFSLSVGCRRLFAPFVRQPQRFAYSSNSTSVQQAHSDQTDSSLMLEQRRRIVLDFNEVRLIGRVFRIIDLGSTHASFVFVTQYLRGPPASSQTAGDDNSPESVGHSLANRQERVYHLVSGRVLLGLPGSSSPGSSGSGPGGAAVQPAGDADADWQQYLFPGSRIEVVGSLAYRLSRSPSVAADDKRKQFEAVIRLSHIVPLSGSGRGRFTDPREEQPQRRQRRGQDFGQDNDRRSHRGGGWNSRDDDDWSTQGGEGKQWE